MAAWLALLASCTTERNPAFCCADPADCSRFGVTEDKLDCAAGLTCVGHTCVSTACASAADCGPAAPVCDSQTSTCVGCLAAADCGSSAPVCDGNSCRACQLDAECASGACADDGTCVAEVAVVYLHPQGRDEPPCSRAQPCQTLRFGVSQTNTERSHIVLAPGSYAEPSLVTISSSSTAAVALWIHGGNATVRGDIQDGVLDIRVPTTVRDLALANSAGAALQISARSTLERLRVRASTGIQNRATLIVRDVDIESTSVGIGISGGSLLLDRAVIHGGASAIQSFAAGVVNISNLLAYGTSDTAVDLPDVTGSISFTTIADSGNNSMDAAGLRCTQLALSIRSSIIWTPTLSPHPSISGGCSLESTIAGPIGIIGAANVNPAFIDPAAANYHLGAGSPARDMANAGPPTDFEGDPRPRGARFDIGADEAP